MTSSPTSTRRSLLTSTHKAEPVREWLEQHPRYRLHFTPTSSSWMNLVERWFGLLTEKPIKRGSHPITTALEEAIACYIDATNADPKPFRWTKSAEEIFASLARFYDIPTTIGSGR